MSGEFKDITKRADLEYLNKKDFRMRFNSAEPLPFLFEKVQDRPVYTLLKEFFKEMTKEVVAALGVEELKKQQAKKQVKKQQEKTHAELLAEREALLKKKQELMEKLRQQGLNQSQQPQQNNQANENNQ